jgi:hypothetical protein
MRGRQHSESKLRAGRTASQLLISRVTFLPLLMFSRLCSLLSSPLPLSLQRNIGSVPVLLKSHKYYGFLDIMDIVKYVVGHFGASELKKERSFFDLLEEEKKFLDCTVGQMMDNPMQLRNPYHPISVRHRREQRRRVSR